MELSTSESVWKGKIEGENRIPSEYMCENVIKLKFIMQMLYFILTSRYLSEERQDRWLLNVTGR